ncbi:hypothetical protein [Alicyclobacillus acidoterrestris]|uniref:Uncharacterized protein n=1 Tax=Alicyclobacillus acidoterrestris (strain ATCC 49025 / DSM 3922 / CIP 106132 / NCIMB 13137 / GD3B) TaxID=1356854 RepID=A0A9E6ZGE0_ALIAG|nr:hypothetical protein [Alicyclobacillus acidoterrestris]UNO48018.1 hypothetical protein K1I37_15195 [Alicyclobacillus acidoterrestris]
MADNIAHTLAAPTNVVKTITPLILGDIEYSPLSADTLPSTNKPIGVINMFAEPLYLFIGGAIGAVLNVLAGVWHF